MSRVIQAVVMGSVTLALGWTTVLGCTSIAGLSGDYSVGGGDSSGTGGTASSSGTGGTGGTASSSGTGGPGGSSGTGGSVPETCLNSLQDGQETDVDCGGSECPPCPNGSGCEDGADCASGFCPPDDGVCCNVACDGPCEACLAVKTEGTDGTCSPIPIFTDPDQECAPPPLGCDGAGACAQCGEVATPSGGTCPGECHFCEGGDTCVFDCDQTDECQYTTINCPQGWHCDIRCGGEHSCRETVISCPDLYRCELSCGSINHSCQETDLVCAKTGPCSTNCGTNDACFNTEIFCGENECTASCNGGATPTLQSCPSTCGCSGC